MKSITIWLSLCLTMFWSEFSLRTFLIYLLLDSRVDCILVWLLSSEFIKS